MSVKNRLLEFIKYSGIDKSVFERKTGLSNGFIDKTGEKIRNASVEKIVNIYPQINRTWLTTGEGEMLTNKKENKIKEYNNINQIPLLPISAQGGSLNDFVLSIKDSNCEKIISPISGANFAIPVSGDSMAPEYPNGSTIFIKKIDEKAFIDWGRVYVLDTCNGTVVKILVPSEKEGYVKCLSINQDAKFAPFEICLADVYGVYRVLLCMSVK